MRYRVKLRKIVVASLIVDANTVDEARAYALSLADDAKWEAPWGQDEVMAYDAFLIPEPEHS